MASADRQRMVDARAAALRSRVEELAMASFKDRDHTGVVSSELMRAGMKFPQGQVRVVRLLPATLDPPPAPTNRANSHCRAAWLLGPSATASRAGKGQ